MDLALFPCGTATVYVGAIFKNPFNMVTKRRSFTSRNLLGYISEVIYKLVS